jgi:hypothetical protein
VSAALAESAASDARVDPAALQASAASVVRDVPAVPAALAAGDRRPGN